MKYNALFSITLMASSLAIGPLLGMQKQRNIPQNRIQVLARQINPQKTTFKGAGEKLSNEFSPSSPIRCSTGTPPLRLQQNFKSELNNLLVNHQLPEETPNSVVIFW